MVDLSKLKRSRIVHLCFAISFFTSILIINIVQLVLFFCLRPINKKAYRKILYYLCYSFHSQVVFLADWWSNVSLNVYIDPNDFEKYMGKEHCLLMMNHTYEIDWLMGWVFCDKIGVLGNCKAYAKKSIQYIPTIGWSWKFAEFVFLERSFDKDKVTIAAQIKEIMDFPDPVWLLLYAEGTRFTKTKHIASQQFAQERGLPVLKHHLTPRTKGFTASLPALREKCPAMYDIQLAFRKDDPIQPNVSNLMNGRAPEAFMSIKRIPLETIPHDEEEAALWLRNHYNEKDAMMERFHTTGSFFAPGTVAPKPLTFQPRLATLFNTAVWAVVTLLPILYYLMKLLLSGELLYFSVGAGIIGIFYLLMHKTIGMSKISKGSSYGSSSPSKKSE